MADLPDVIRDEHELDEVLSRPSPALVVFMARLDGDLMVLGARGKMGPTLVRMARRKFGSTGDEPGTWAANVIVPYHVARTFTGSRIAAFSTGGVYPLVDAAGPVCTEDSPAGPIGEYAMSCLGRERMFDYVSARTGLRAVHLRLSYAVETRYGVLADVAARVWQGDACDYALRSLAVAASPPRILNITGPWKVSISETAETFGRLLGRPPVLVGEDSGQAFLSDASASHALFGPPAVPLERIIRWTADWVRRGGRNLGKPTHFEVRDGQY